MSIGSGFGVHVTTAAGFTGYCEERADQRLHLLRVFWPFAAAVVEAERPGVMAAVLGGVIAVTAFAHVVAGGQQRLQFSKGGCPVSTT